MNSTTGIDLSNIKLDKNKKSMIKKILSDDRTYFIGVVILGIATLVICSLMILGVLWVVYLIAFTIITNKDK